MGKSSLSVQYIKGKPYHYFMDLNEPMPSTQAIAWCMTQTEVARMFTKEDMHEFLFRLPILFHLREFVEDWLVNGTLFNYFYRGKEYILTIDDLAMHLGLEAYDHYMNVTPRERYLKRVPWSRNFALEVGHSGNYSMLRIDGTKLVVNNLIYAPEITPGFLSKSQFFAADAMKFIPKHVFSRTSKNLKRKQKDLDERAERIASLQDFDLSKLPSEVLKACLEKICNYGPKDKILAMPGQADAIDKKIRPMIFIAWTWANHFFFEDGVFTPGKDIFSGDYLDYEAEDAGYNLYYNIELPWLERLVPVLKDVQLSANEGELKEVS